MSKDEVRGRLEKAGAHVEFVIKLYQPQLAPQLARGAHFLHEHLATAASWDLPSMQELLNDPRVDTVVGHMCRFGVQ
eukprot:562933-Alexandrium_andersonii.AAC.1